MKRPLVVIGTAPIHVEEVAQAVKAAAQVAASMVVIHIAQEAVEVHVQVVAWEDVIT